MKFYHKLPIPQDVKAHYPVTDSMAAVKAKRDREIKDVFEGKSDKFILIIGPCCNRSLPAYFFEHFEVWNVKLHNVRLYNGRNK